MRTGDRGGRTVEVRRTFLGAGLSFLTLGCVLGVFWLWAGWRPLAVAGGACAGAGAVLALLGAYIHWQGSD
jgi:hypothetical protein